MGLGVYLYWEKDRNEIEAHENKVDEITDNVYNEIKERIGDRDLTNEEWAEYREKVNKQLESEGISKDIPESMQKCIEMDSKQYPEHYFKIGYFRSSYNDGGINNILEKTINTRLDDIFDVDNHSYVIKPDWNKARDKTIEAIDKYLKHLKESNGFRTIRVREPFAPAKSEQDAYNMFIDQQKRWTDKDYQFGSYGNGIGCFIPKGISVYGVFITPSKYGLRQNPSKDTILVVKDNNFVPEEDWYYTALLIVLETIDWVLAQPDKDNYALHWSG